jgi:hypothetical protein
MFSIIWINDRLGSSSSLKMLSLTSFRIAPSTTQPNPSLSKKMMAPFPMQQPPPLRALPAASPFGRCRSGHPIRPARFSPQAL